MDRDTTIQDIVSKLNTLRLQEAVLTQQLEEALKQPNTASPAQRKDCWNDFTKGDRIVIKNKLNRPANWTSKNTPWNETEGRTATVTHIIKRGDINQALGKRVTTLLILTATLLTNHHELFRCQHHSECLDRSNRTRIQLGYKSWR